MSRNRFDKRGRDGMKSTQYRANSTYSNGSVAKGSKEWKEREQQNIEADEIDAKFHYSRLTTGAPRSGYLFNMRTTGIREEETGLELSAVDGYFVEEDGSTFKATCIYQPYFMVQIKATATQVQELEQYLMRRFEGLITSARIVLKEDLDLPNHLSGIKQPYMKISFRNVTDLMSVRRELMPIILRNRDAQSKLEAYGMDEQEHDEDTIRGSYSHQQQQKRTRILDVMIDIREYDVPYVQRVAIDLGYRCGVWYTVTPIAGTIGCEFTRDMSRLQPPLIKKLAFDIETTKSPLKFPNSDVDQIMMISYMLDEQGYLIVNREIVSEDINDFEYTPLPEYEGPFKVFNEPNEKLVLKRFFEHIKQEKPQIYITYNGDFFDWPFIDKRKKKIICIATIHGMNLMKEIGVWKSSEDEYMGRFSVHLDAFAWVKRDSYLPQGSQGLKAVTKAKLKYDPVELDPEDMLPYASERPQELAAYSVSDAVATYYLYVKYVHSFIFALSTIIPMPPSDVLRKGSGTLCEMLLMVQAFEGNIIAPNKQAQEYTKFYEGHLLESETYVGGHVECLESGVYRSDLPVKFRLSPKRLQMLMDTLDETLKFALTVELKVSLDDVIDYDDIRNKIASKLQSLHDHPNIEIEPLIYHLDVAAMYPNIILTNRLQPMAIVDPATCAACDFNRPESNCKRVMSWSWRGKYFTANRAEYERVKAQLEYESVKDVPQPTTNKFGQEQKTTPINFSDLKEEEQATRIKARVKAFSHRSYKTIHIEKTEERQATICQRENPFYVDTVRAFRDRRYEYKHLGKKWKKEVDDAKTELDRVKANDMLLLYDSLQLAHKCILNSFYGYVMRKGARWHSIEMAGVVTKTGADIIKEARVLVEEIGRPLELDTDGIWCMLPASFPENFKFQVKNKDTGKISSVTVSYPCSMLNVLVHRNFANDQYQTLINPDKHTYKTQTECSIFFEVDGPYRAMVLPAAKDEGKSIKKRYAVFNHDGSLAELKGFELKRRGELKLIKIFQGEVFKSFLNGSTLQECYDAVGAAANHWLDIMDNQGADLQDSDLFDLISESKNMTETLEDYGDRKSTAISTARRLGEFLGEEMIKDRGLACQFVILKKPHGASVSERAYPVAIFSAEPAIMKHYLRKWLKDPALNDFDIRSLLDWDYYIGRLGSAIQKIITIPAAFQRIKNPCPRIAHPDWLHRKVRERSESHKQTRLANYFQAPAGSVDMEDIASTQTSFTSPMRQQFAIVKRKRITVAVEEDGENGDVDVNMIEEKEQVPEKEKETDDKPNKDLITIDDTDNTDKENEPIPDETTDPTEWIQYQKKLWNKQRIRKQREKMEANRGMLMNDGNHKSSHTSSTMKNGLQGYLQQTAQRLRQNYWQIVQMIEDESNPGLFRVWVFVDSTSLQCINVRVPRTFYMNTRQPNETAANQGRQVERTLPRGRPCQYLYEITMDESLFRSNAKAMASFLHHPQVEGVYETQVTLAFRFLCDVGCVAKLDSSIDRRLRDISLPHLQYKTTSECPYFVDTQFSRVYLYQSHTNDRRGIVALWMPALSQLLIIAITRASRSDLGAIKYDETYTQALVSVPHPEGEFTSISPTVTTRTAATLDDAYKMIRNKIKEYKGQTRQATIVLSQSGEQLSTLYMHVPEFKTDFPVVTIPSHDTDNTYPTLNWFPHAVRRMMQRYIQTGDWWIEQIRMCRYAHIPIGNLETDFPAQVGDIFFARALKANNHLLWMSSSPRPDLGGLEEDDNYFADEHHNPEITSSGCYRSICMEFNMDQLAVNTILNESLIEEMEGGNGMRPVVDVKQDGDQSIVSSMSEGSYATRDAFRVLKTCVTNWFTDTVKNQNQDADMLLRHFYRWLRSTTSKLYDPALHGMIHKLMHKVWMQLLARLRKLGSTVIYASFSKIILCTNKNNVAHATAYTNFILEAILSRGLFQYIDLQATTIWETLLFMDVANHGGIVSSSNADVVEIDQQGQPQIISHWNLADYLPPVVQTDFIQIVSEFLLRPYQHMQELSTSHPSQAQSQSESYLTPQEREAALTKWLIEQIRTTFSRRLLRVLHNIKTISTPEDEIFPQLAGSHLIMTSPALEFAKAVTHVMSLDSSVTLEISKLKHNLMKLLDVKSFSEKAEFINPCLTFVLPDVICSYCNQCRDLDLCRDPDLLAHRWYCITCHQPYDKHAIESQLVEIVTRRNVAYQVQDVACCVCTKIKVTNLAQYCPCSGSYQNTESAKAFQTKLRTFSNIASYHQFEWLGETVAWLQQQQPSSSLQSVASST